MKVLAVDGDPASRVVLASCLRALGYGIELADDADEAWRLLEATAVETMVMASPVLQQGGLELCRRIRVLRGDSIYVILLTEMEMSDTERALASEAGVDDCLGKPLRADQLERRLRVAERFLARTVQLRALQALLPVCGRCRKVRDDADYWEEIEDYIGEHAEALANCGTCPDCDPASAVPWLPATEPALGADPAGADPAGRRPSMTLIARKLGTSSATVSMALRGSPRISAEMRERVAAAALSLGYRPDPEIRKAMRHVRGTRKLGFKSVIYGLATLPAEERLPFHQSLIHGCEERAREDGYDFVVLRVREQDEGRLQRMLLNRGVEGILLLSVGPQMERLREHLDWSKFSVVTAANGELAPGFDAVRPHWYYSVRRTHEELLAGGARRIGVVLNAHFDRAVDFCLTAAAREFGGHGAGDPLAPVVFAAPMAGETPSGAVHAARLPHGERIVFDPVRQRWTGLREWYARERPDALVFDHDPFADAAIAELVSAGVTPPVVAVLNRAAHSQHAGMEQCPREVGVAAIGSLAHKIERGVKGPQKMLSVTKIKGRWVPRPPEVDAVRRQ